MKTFMLLAVLLSLALSSQAAGLNLENIVQGLNDLADNKRELEVGNVEDESQDMQEGEMGLNLENIVQGLNDLADNKRELEVGNVEDESQDMQEGEMDESELQDDSIQLEAQGDDLQQKRELDFEENENENEEDLLSQRELGEKSVDLQNENTEANSKRWYGCRYSHRWVVCKRVLHCRRRHFKRCTSTSCVHRFHKVCVIQRKSCVRRKYCHYYKHCRKCYYSTYRKFI
ncbi:uncharacterized protein LOC120539393 isoform X2 [Polypterus senegalus]|uniref:uncharacterized protein LOC120539393 isoform X2 n=1 Tax=Polypterus senegalus TaxID=55291 RepID=UPI0019651423|nr:uncharacterized protein LOC120539393 isoform X2 [Polypterus senegalus]